jgi:hypothetical protein
MNRCTTVFLVIADIFQQYDGPVYQAFTTEKLAQDEIAWYRRQYWDDALDGIDDDDKERMIYCGDIIDDEDYLYVVDELRIQIESITLTDTAH